MNFADQILQKKGTLAKIWLAAHFERKLSKTQFLQTNISNSVVSIIEVGNATMTLRLTGQLLLGVVRIYSKKAKYLLEDCNEALLKIKMAFRPGAVNLTEDQQALTATHLLTNLIELDILMPEPTLDMDAILNAHNSNQSQNLSRFQDITMQPKAMLEINHDLTFDFDIEKRGGEWDLNLADDSVDVEIGREAQIRSFSPNLTRDIEVGRDASEIKNFSFEDPMNQEGGFGNDDMMILADEQHVNISFNETPIAKRGLGQDSPIVLKQRKRSAAKRNKKVQVDSEIELNSNQIMQQLNDTDEILLEKVIYVAITSTLKRLRDENLNDIDILLKTNRKDYLPKQLRMMFDFDKNIEIYATSSKRNETSKPIDQTFGNDPSFIDFGETGFGNNDLTIQEDLSVILPNQSENNSAFLPDISVIDNLLEPLNQTLYDIEEEEVHINQSVGLSKSTLKTIQLLGDKFCETEQVTFDSVTNGVSRSDACRFFFEVLVLKTRDLIDVEQDTPFGDIKVSAKSTFFEQS